MATRPKLWDAAPGAINPEVAKYWRDHYDLTALLQREWERLGPKLQGKLHVTMGTKDTSTWTRRRTGWSSSWRARSSRGEGRTTAGPSSSGTTNRIATRERSPKACRFMTHFVRVFAEYIGSTAPKGSDLGWR